LQASLHLLSFIRIFDFVQNTPVRQIASKLAFALTYSYFCKNLQTDTVMKIIKPLAITFAALTALLIIIALATPPIAKNYIIKHSKEWIGRQINLQGLYLNLFTGYTRLTGFQLLEQDDQQTFVAFDTLSVELSLLRLLADEIRINHIHLANPHIRLLQNGTNFNFDDLLALGQNDTTPVNDTLPPSSSPDSLTEKNSGGMAVAIYDISISGGHIRYEDLSRQSVWEMENFGLQIPGVYFSGQNTDVGIALNFNDGGHLQTAMQYNMEAGNYLLDVELTNFSISPVRPYLTDFLNISHIDGLLNTHLNIEGNARHVTDLTVRGDLQLSHLALTARPEERILSADSIVVVLENLNPGKALFHFQTVAVNGLQTAFELDKDGNTLTRLLKESSTDTLATAPEETPATTPVEEPAPDLKINTFRINNSLFVFNDHTLHTPFTFSLENIHLIADNLTLDQQVKAKITSTLKNGGTIHLSYTGTPEDISNTDVLLTIKNLDLKTFTPYSLQYFGYPLKKGILSFSSINDIRDNQLDGRNHLDIAQCEVDNKQKNPKPEYNLPLKTALYLIKDKNDLIKMDLPVQGNINSPEFSYRKIIFKTLTNLLVKVAVSPVTFLANSLGFSPDKLRDLPFEAVQNDFTPEQITRINQLAEIIQTKPDMTLVMEQYVNLNQSKTDLARFYVKRNYYLQLYPEKQAETLQPIDYSKIREIDIKDPDFLTYVDHQVSEAFREAETDEQIVSLADSTQLHQLTNSLINRRNQLLTSYLLRQGVPEKCLRISTASTEKLSGYTGKNQYTIQLNLESDEE